MSLLRPCKSHRKIIPIPNILGSLSTPKHVIIKKYVLVFTLTKNSSHIINFVIKRDPLTDQTGTFSLFPINMVLTAHDLN